MSVHAIAVEGMSHKRLAKVSVEVIKDLTLNWLIFAQFKDQDPCERQQKSSFRPC